MAPDAPGIVRIRPAGGRSAPNFGPERRCERFAEADWYLDTPEIPAGVARQQEAMEPEKVRTLAALASPHGHTRSGTGTGAAPSGRGVFRSQAAPQHPLARVFAWRRLTANCSTRFGTAALAPYPVG